MSLHAQLSPEAEAKLEAQKRNSVITSVVISLLVLALIILVLLFILLPSLLLSSPSLVTYQAGMPDEDKMERKEITDQIQRKPSAPSSSMAKVIASSTPSPTAVPVPETDAEPNLDFGSGDDFGAGWGSGGDGGGGGFGNIPAVMRKRCSKEDRLTRLKNNGGSEKCEDAVVATLDWLQEKQNKDGSWCGNRRVAMTGLALLTYLGHCETPLSEKYGETVQAAIVYLIDVAMNQKGKLADNLQDNHWPYEHAIGTYAIAEAYTFCKQLSINLPGLHDAVRDAGQWILDNQSTKGSWDYAYAENEAAGGRSSGGDNSIGCWQLQALKACKTTGIEFRNMTAVVRKGLAYIEESQSQSGAINYAGQGTILKVSSLAGAGALVYQMFDKTSHSVPRKACRYVGSDCPFKWDTASCDLYALYYNAQAMINYGGKTWLKYNAMFMPEVLNNQNKDGSFADVGANAAGEIIAVAPMFKGGGDVSGHYRTCLSALTLEVYYRFLPGTGQKTK
ncbi:MAG: prenyltransferase/squalene oxidase repeat-containing protein [Roseibacillus sp.]